MRSSRFAVAVHVLALLAMSEDEPVTSEYLAGSVNTNPVVVRRLLVLLGQAGLVDAQPGSGGGALLAQQPEQMTLLQVYQAVEESRLFAFHQKKPDPRCLCGRNIQPVLRMVLVKVERAMQRALQEMTLAQVVREIWEHEAAADRTRRR